MLEPPKCAECGSPMELRNSRFGKFWGCTKFPMCKGAHGAHEDGRPLGIPADRATKQLRIKAHEAFDRLWKGRQMTRSKAYRWLQEQLGLSSAACHIGQFDADKCKQVIKVCQADNSLERSK